jgi:PAS domain S-box-containing protein
MQQDLAESREPFSSTVKKLRGVSHRQFFVGQSPTAGAAAANSSGGVMIRSMWMVGLCGVMAALICIGPVREVIHTAPLDAIGLDLVADPRFGMSIVGLTSVLGLAGLGISVRKRSTAARSLHRHEELTRRVWDAVDNGLILVDADERVSEWNPAIERLTGVPRREAIGTAIGRFPLLEHPRHRECLRLALKGIETASGHVPCHTTHGDGPLSLRAYYSPIRRADGQIAGGLVVVARAESGDVSEGVNERDAAAVAMISAA